MQATRISRPASTKRQSGDAAVAPNWMVACDAKRLRRLRLAARLEVAWGSHHDPPHLADLAGDQAGIGEVTDPDGEVDAVFHQVDHAVRQPQFAGDLGIAHQIGRHHRADVQASETDRGRDRQPPARPRAFALDRAFGFLDIGEDAPDPLEIARADIGQRHRPRGPLQQPRAETVLQRRDQPRHARRRQPQLARRRRKTPEVGDGDKGLHGVDAIHGIISYIAMMKCQSG